MGRPGGETPADSAPDIDVLTSLAPRLAQLATARAMTEGNTFHMALPAALAAHSRTNGSSMQLDKKRMNRNAGG